ncbi:TPA: helix-turn-helix transcriptional regulator [Elizabethkingia anophelis]|nr:helix-turn-helix transcriptional regulator [Elizabethkingia anophelis]
MKQIIIETINVKNEIYYNDCRYYKIFLINNPTRVTIDFTTYYIEGPALIFLTPDQHIEWNKSSLKTVIQLKFLGDFYCLDHHKCEVSCNGILFNSIYIYPFVKVDYRCYNEIEDIVLNKINKELSNEFSISESVVKSYLQVVLTLSSREKKQQLKNVITEWEEKHEGCKFQELIEKFFLTNKTVEFYANKLNISKDSFSRKIKKQMGKSPSKLIQERVILESKRLLYLTNLSVKEIAAILSFEDENYFSRYFKKNTGIAPSEFRMKMK